MGIAARNRQCPARLRPAKTGQRHRDGRARPSGGEEIRIRIDDEGPGVPKEHREAIFNRFHSVRPHAESFGRHSGLGLAIARAIVEGHDGEIDVEDRDDAPSGARFTIILKAADRQ